MNLEPGALSKVANTLLSKLVAGRNLSIEEGEAIAEVQKSETPLISLRSLISDLPFYHGGLSFYELHCDV